MEHFVETECNRIEAFRISVSYTFIIGFSSIKQKKSNHTSILGLQKPFQVAANVNSQ